MQRQILGGSGGEPKLPGAGHGCENQHPFHPRQALANTLPHARTEGEVTEARPAAFVLLSEALRVETQRIFPETRVAVGYNLRRQENGSFRNGYAAILVSFCRRARGYP